MAFARESQRGAVIALALASALASAVRDGGRADDVHQLRAGAALHVAELVEVGRRQLEHPLAVGAAEHNLARARLDSHLLRRPRRRGWRFC